MAILRGQGISKMAALVGCLLCSGQFPLQVVQEMNSGKTSDRDKVQNSLVHVKIQSWSLCSNATNKLL